MNQAKGLVIAGLAGGSGKSVVSVGITAALRRGGSRVVPFKKGPDYIDAGWLQLAAGNKCYNLDPYFMSRKAIEESFSRRSIGADYVIVEGNRGLYDGVNVEGGYSTAELAHTLDLPVILVVNCTKTTRTVAAMVLGCQMFDPRIKIRGVVLNQIANTRQRRLVTESVEKYTGLPVFGSIPRLKMDIFPMRHLGMIPHQEYNDSSGALDFLVDLIVENLDLEKIKQTMQFLPFTASHEPCTVQAHGKQSLRIGVLQDAAFQFYYSENLEALEREGAELLYINAMQDSCLPDLDGLYIGGGFPETGAKELAANESFRKSVKEAADKGLPIYAECGGLIYLGESLVLAGKTHPLVGIFPVQFEMSKKPQAHGYSIFEVDRENGFYPVGTIVKGHEFRYSKVVNWRGADDQLVVKMSRGTGFVDGRDGLTYKNVFALYTHVHAEGTPEWARGFVEKCQRAMAE
jgi:cobyrinic acid a,c-diamide synthase